jgi:hypothetical protein
MKRMRIATRAQKSLAGLAVLAALGAGAGALSGCGTSTTLDPIARAAEVSSQQEGARFSLSVRLYSPMLSGTGFAVSANGYVDERKRTGELTMDLSGIPGASNLPGGGAGTVKMIFAYPVIYMDMPFLAGQLPAGKTWMKLDLRKAAQAAGIDLSQLSSLNQDDPTQLLEYLRASSGGVTTVGSETLDGVATTHYRGTLQLGSILDRLPASYRDAAKAALEKLGNAGAIPVEVWVDDQHRVRRMQMSLGASAPASSPGSGASAVSGTVTIDFTSYGAVPPIVPPPDSEVFEASSLAGLAGGQGG